MKCLESQNSHEKECKSLKRCQYVCVREMELTDAQPSDVSFMDTEQLGTNYEIRGATLHIPFRNMLS